MNADEVLTGFEAQNDPDFLEDLDEDSIWELTKNEYAEILQQ